MGYISCTQIYGIGFPFLRKPSSNDILDELKESTTSDESEVGADEFSGMVKKSEAHDLYSMPTNDGTVADEDSGQKTKAWITLVSLHES